MLTEVKVQAVYKKKRFRGKRNPKQRKLRKKKQKKFQMESEGGGEEWRRRVRVSYGECFWHNYSKAIKWSTTCVESYWRLEAHRLQLENARLKRTLQSLSDYPVTDGGLSEDGFHSEENRDDVKDAASDLEVTEEFMHFIEASLKHKLSLKKKRERDGEKCEDEGGAGGCDVVQVEGVFEAPREDTSVRRSSEMKQLYGGDSAKIQGMETAVHLGFLRKCDKCKPVVWPVVALAPLTTSSPH